MKKFVFIFLFFLATGCAIHAKPNYIEVVKRAGEEVNPLDGFDKSEVSIWAQYLTIREGIHEELASLEPIKAKKRIFWIKDGQVFDFDVPPSRSAGFKKYQIWRVYFAQKRDLRHLAYVEFDAQTGELVNIGLEK